MRGAGRRIQDRKHPPSTPNTSAGPDPWQYLGGGRDSDASLCSSRPSSIGLNPGRASAVPIADRSYQLSAIRSINSYLSSHSAPIALKPPLPSAKDITETLRFVLSHLDYGPIQKLEEDLYSVLKLLNCPVKLNKSAIRAPGTPHTWPSLLGVIHWLVQIAKYNDHLSNSSQNASSFENNSMFSYALNSYLHYIRGDDDSVEALDNEFVEKLQHERKSMEENEKVLADKLSELELQLEGLKSGPTDVEKLEKEKNVLEEDVKKFHAMIDQLDGHILMVQKALEEKEKELEAKVGERQRIMEENEELKKKVEEQGINARDAERMKRELQAVERDIREAEVSRNAWEEKTWDLDTAIGHKFKELEGLVIEGNQAIRRLKLGNGLQYELNAKGSSPADVLGIDYKSTLVPALASLSDDVKKSSMAKLEELISLQQQSADNAAKIEAKRNRIAALQSHIDEVEAQLNSIKNETQDYTSRCAMEARKLVEEVEIDGQKLDTLEREVDEYLKTANMKLQEAIVETEEEVQKCASELLVLVDLVSKYKEYMSLKISEMKNDVSGTVDAVTNIHKTALQGQFGNIFGRNG